MFTLAGAHLGNLSAKQGKASEELNVKVGLIQGPAGRFAHEREYERDIFVPRCACFARAGAHFIETRAQFFISERL